MPRDDQRSLRARLLAQAYALLADLSARPDPVTVSATDEVACVTITVAPAGAAALRATPALSTLERRIVEAIGREAMTGKRLAGKLGQRYDATLRTILSNLADRGVIESTRSGYRVVSDSV